MTHTVSVSASSLYEAAAIALAEFKKSGFAIASVGPATRLKVAVEAPTRVHELSIGKLQTWLDSNGKTPREQAVKVTLRQLSVEHEAGALRRASTPRGSDSCLHAQGAVRRTLY